ncbi:MAG: M23 family metallopeptidase, partial [Acidimicrobiales bacterium]
HEGIDLFAAQGTPLVATERGVITKVGVGRLGGLKFWLKGESGSEWYYAHLDSFAPGLADGIVVEAGQLVGFVGNTGNAIGTPPHLHMQLHPNGGQPVNPYPLLKIVSDIDLAAIANGTHAGYDYGSSTVLRPDPNPVDEPTTTGPAEPDPGTSTSPSTDQPPATNQPPARDQPTTQPSTATTTSATTSSAPTPDPPAPSSTGG